MKAVAAKLGVEMVVTDVAFDTIVSGVQAGKANCGAAGMTINDERKESVDFSIPYSSTEQYLIVPAADETLKTVEDLKGKSIGVQEGTTSDFLVSDLIADKTLDGATLTPYKTPAAAAAVVGTKVDAVVTDKLTAQIIVEGSNGAYKTFPCVKADGSPVAEVEEYGVAVAKGNETLLAVINEVLTGLINEGKIAEWEAYYNDLAATIEE
jgi:polar amino acid transport system substrate-binding protein